MTWLVYFSLLFILLQSMSLFFLNIQAVIKWISILFCFERPFYEQVPKFSFCLLRIAIYFSSIKVFCTGLYVIIMVYVIWKCAALSILVDCLFCKHWADYYIFLSFSLNILQTMLQFPWHWCDYLVCGSQIANALYWERVNTFVIEKKKDLKGGRGNL